MVGQQTYDAWLGTVREVLASINMPMDQWQTAWQFDFSSEYKAGTDPRQAATKANRFWWFEQNKTLKQHCRKTADCWLPEGHSGTCEPV